ncbi:hypothetical protein RHMOL_RhmolUnG0000600 [Rhododendron molle]|nr:hypothetical protein RHMOL_RhmolUnG0000600 [Rhododendron molle]
MVEEKSIPVERSDHIERVEFVPPVGSSSQEPTMSSDWQKLEEAQMARAYLLYLFGATLYPNKRSTVHLSYLPALRDLGTASWFDWGEAALGTCYAFMGEFSREAAAPAVVGLRGAEDVPAREQVPSPEDVPSCHDLGVNWDPWTSVEPEPEYVTRSRAVTASRVLLESAFGWQWYLGDRVTRQSLELDEFLVPGLLPRHASQTARYTLAELQRFTVPQAASTFTRPRQDYAVYRKQHLMDPLGVIELMAVRKEVARARQERQGQKGRSSRSRERNVYA